MLGVMKIVAEQGACSHGPWEKNVRDKFACLIAALRQGMDLDPFARDTSVSPRTDLAS